LQSTEKKITIFLIVGISEHSPLRIVRVHTHTRVTVCMLLFECVFECVCVVHVNVW